MTDIVEDLERSAKEIRDEGHAGWGNVCADAADEIESLRKDAERYRWLRDENDYGKSEVAVMLDNVWVQALDGFVDTAMNDGLDAAFNAVMGESHE